MNVAAPVQLLLLWSKVKGIEEAIYFLPYITPFPHY